MSLEKLNMNKKELKEFFEKYNLLELEMFNSILEYVYDYDITDILEVARKVYLEKYKNCDDYFEVVYSNKKLSFNSSIKKINKLNDKELNFLLALSNSALMCLTSIDHIDVEEEIIEITKIINSISDKINEKEKIKSKKLKLQK